MFLTPDDKHGDICHHIVFVANWSARKRCVIRYRRQYPWSLSRRNHVVGAKPDASAGQQQPDQSCDRVKYLWEIVHFSAADAVVESPLELADESPCRHVARQGIVGLVCLVNERGPVYLLDAVIGEFISVKRADE